jgi:hypothetical protein
MAGIWTMIRTSLLYGRKVCESYSKVDDHNGSFLSAGRSHKLLLWNVKQPPVPSVDDSSAVTLVEVSVFDKIWPGFLSPMPSRYPG